jgi:hypothetical protein
LRRRANLWFESGSGEYRDMFLFEWGLLRAGGSLGFFLVDERRLSAVAVGGTLSAAIRETAR